MFIETMTVTIYKNYKDFFGGKSELLVTNGKIKYVACLQLQKCIIYSYFIPLCCLLITCIFCKTANDFPMKHVDIKVMRCRMYSPLVSSWTSTSLHITTMKMDCLNCIWKLAALSCCSLIVLKSPIYIKDTLLKDSSIVRAWWTVEHCT